jgi:hypothetical protein
MAYPRLSYIPHDMIEKVKMRAARKKKRFCLLNHDQKENYLGAEALKTQKDYRSIPACIQGDKKNFRGQNSSLSFSRAYYFSAVVNLQNVIILPLVISHSPSPMK